jgi:copper(I)-binding protein
VSRAQHNSTASRRLVVTTALALGLGLAAAGCGAGQITQTDTQVAAVNGASGSVGAIAVRDAQLAFPTGTDKYYPAGSDVPLVVTITNRGDLGDDKLVSVTSDAASGAAQITGDPSLPAGHALQAGLDKDDDTARTSGAASSTPSPTSTPSATSSAPQSSSSASSSAPSGSSSPSSPSSASSAASSSAAASATGKPLSIGSIRIVLPGLAKDLRPGQTIRVHFLFQKAGELVLDLPIAAPTDPRLPVSASR